MPQLSHSLLRLVQAGGIAGDAIARAGQIRAGNTKFRAASQVPGAEGKNVVENPVVAGSDLIDQVWRKRRGFPLPPHCARGFRCAGCCRRRCASDHVGEPPGTKFVA